MRALLRRHENDWTVREFPDRPVVVSRPEPWRQHPNVNEFYIVPIGFVLLFAGRQELHGKINKDAEHIANLARSIDSEGLREPLEFRLDPNGKLRLQEGYHRTAAISKFVPDMAMVPVTIKRSRGNIRSFGRRVDEVLEEILTKFMEVHHGTSTH